MSIPVFLWNGDEILLHTVFQMPVTCAPEVLASSTIGANIKPSNA